MVITPYQSAVLDVTGIQNALLYVLSDVHSNLPALNAVLSTIPRDSVILFLGDYVGYYVEPNQVCNYIRSLKTSYCISGNHDMYVTGKMNFNKEKDALYRSSWTKNILSTENMQWLKQLPYSLCITVLGSKHINTILMHHGDLKHPENYVYPNTTFDFCAIEQKTLVLLGNTHHPMIRQDGTKLILNPGSVGQPRDYNSNAAYATINLTTGVMELKRVSYDVKSYQKKLRAQNIDAAAVDILSRSVEAHRVI